MTNIEFESKHPRGSLHNRGSFAEKNNSAPECAPLGGLDSVRESRTELPELARAREYDRETQRRFREIQERPWSHEAPAVTLAEDLASISPDEDAATASTDPEQEMHYPSYYEARERERNAAYMSTLEPGSTEYYRARNEERLRAQWAYEDSIRKPHDLNHDELPDLHLTPEGEEISPEHLPPDLTAALRSDQIKDRSEDGAKRRGWFHRAK